jgi:ATP-dependent DNA helicase RecG
MPTEQTQLALFDEPPTSVDALVAKREDQWFDRKSFRVKDYDLAAALIGFANADGGRIAVGIHKGEIEGVGSDIDHLNTLVQAAINFSSPPVRHAVSYVDCVNRRGQPDRVLLLDVEASETIHRNKRNECHLRVGDETRLLGPTEERELAFDKGESVFDKSLVADLGREDLDLAEVQAYADKTGVRDIASLLRSRGLYLDGPYRRGVTQAGWLLFGKTPPIWSYVRYSRYDGTTIETGTRSNLIEDVRLDGTIPSLIEQAKALIRERLTAIRLTSSGRFGRVPTLPEFAWLEAIVNAVTHRSYSLQGDGVRVRQFSDRLEVESPGRLPGLVRVQNIRNARYARNPHVARVLAEITNYVREQNEGVRRMFEEMEQSGLREPVYESTGASVRVVLFTASGSIPTAAADVVTERLALMRQRYSPAKMNRLLSFLRAHRQAATSEVAQALGVSRRAALNYLEQLQSIGLIARTGRSPNDPTSVWIITDAPFWQSGQSG